MMRRKIARWLSTVAFLYLLICFLVWAFQERLVYVPGPPPTLNPSAWQLDHEKLWLDVTSTERLHGWYVPAVEARGVLLFCHGNAGSIENRLGWLRVFHDMGVSVLLFDYRGFGKSSGRPSEQGTYEDATAALEWLWQKGHKNSEIVVYGESLGGAVAIELAANHELAGLITEATFTSLPAVGARQFPWLPVRWLARYDYDSLSKIAAVKCPKLFLHSPDDSLIPVSHAHQLLQASPNLSRLVLTQGDHNDGGFLGSTAARSEVRRTLRQMLPIR